MTVLGQLLLSGTAVLAVYFLMSRFRAVDGFTLGEVMLCFGTVYLAFGLAELFVRGFDTFPSMLGNGEFDRIMVRPRGLVFQVLASSLTSAGSVGSSRPLSSSAMPFRPAACTGRPRASSCSR